MAAAAVVLLGLGIWWLVRRRLHARLRRPVAPEATRFLCGEQQFHGEGRATSDGALHPDSSADPGEDVAADRQPEPGAPRPPAWW